MKWSSTILSLAVLLDASSSSSTSCSHVYAFAPTGSTGSTGSISRATATKSLTSRLFLLDPLAKEGEWAAYLDDVNTGLVYYFNANTGESLWEPPTRTFPKVALDPNQRVKAQSKQQQYKASVVGGDDVVAVVVDDGSSSTSTTDTTTTSTTTTTTTNDSRTQQREENTGGGGFPFFGRGKKTEEVPVLQEEAIVVAEKKGRFGLGAIFGGNNKASNDDTNNNTDNVVNGAAIATAATATTTATTTASKKASPQKKVAKIIAPQVADATIKLDMSAYVLPHPAKVGWGGEDAVFIRGRSFGVFDGVSGAEKLDGVPLYSVTLAQELKTMVDPKEFLTVPAITKVLTSAAEFADKAATGASTAVVASLSEDGDLNVLNVGDCTCAVVRDNRIVAKTREIIHFFDCPYQLSEDSPDRPRDGTKLTVKVQKGDVIVMGSDGIFDNLQDAEICKLVSNQKTRASMLARKVVERSRRVSLDETADTPYAKLAKRNGDIDYQSGLGGKVDDVSCIVVKCT